MKDTETYVNYVSYGSNTNYDRFIVYITGGKAPGSTHEHEGCDDKTPPAMVLPVSLQHELYFKEDPDEWWGKGGTAFIAVEPGDEQPTLAVAYRITLAQFAQVVAQEDGNGLKPPHIDLATLKDLGHIALFPGGLYGELVYCGEDEAGVPNLSFTNAETPQPQEYMAPPAPYLGVIARGLMAVHGLSVPETATYFAGKKGVKGLLTAQDIASIIIRTNS